MILKTLIFITLLLQTSCVFLAQNNLAAIDQNNLFYRFCENEKSLIIFRIDGRQNSKVRICPKKKASTQKCQIFAKNPGATKDYRLAMFEPGNYEISALTYKTPIWPDSKAAGKLSFSVKSRDISYIGDLRLQNYRQSHLQNSKKRTSNLSARDKFEKLEKLLQKKKIEEIFSAQPMAIKQLNKSYPKWSKKTQKNLATEQ